MHIGRGRWVRVASGLYGGDLGLIWDPLAPTHNASTDGSTCLTVLVVPRLSVHTFMSRLGSQIRPPAGLVDMKDVRIDFDNLAYDGKQFYQGLLAMELGVESVKPTLPTFPEMDPFAKAGFGTSLWKRLLSLETLRTGDRVVVTSGRNKGADGFFGQMSGSNLFVCNIEEEGVLRYLTSSIMAVERLFKAGDRISWISCTQGQRDRFGKVVNVRLEEWGNTDDIHDRHNSLSDGPAVDAPPPYHCMYVNIVEDGTMNEVSSRFP